MYNFGFTLASNTESKKVMLTLTLTLSLLYSDCIYVHSRNIFNAHIKDIFENKYKSISNFAKYAFFKKELNLI